MAGRIDARLRELGIVLPEPAKPVANYVPYTVAGDFVFVAGQGPMADGKLTTTGKLGAGVSIEDGAAACRLAFVNVLAQLRAACGGDLDRVAMVARLGGFIACVPDFTQQALVMNGASDLAVAVFGDSGRHARTTIGVPVLPMDMAVEVDGIFRIA